MSATPAHDLPQSGANAPAWERIDTGPLSWVMGELRSSLERSLESLRAFSKNPDDIGALRLARSALHQAHGALQLVDLEGVSLVTEEVEHLLEAFEAAPERANEHALEVVGGAFRAVIQYLEELLEGAAHQPVRLFPSYRSLLSLRGADRIHPADLFYPDLSIRPPRQLVQGAPLSAEGVAQQRTIFERALLVYLRDDTNRAAAADMQSAVEKIESTPKQGQQRAFWWVTRAFFDALAADALPADLNVKRLAARINLQIRRLLEGSGMVAERLLRDTLFFVARAQHATAHISDVKQVYGLNNSLPEDFETERYSELNFPAVRAAKEALASAKTAWSLVVAGDANKIAEFAREASALLSAVGSLHRPGLADVAQVVASIGTELSFDPRKPGEAVALDTATAMLFLEGALDQVRSLDEQFDERAKAVVARVQASALGASSEEPDPTWLDEISRQAQERLTMTSFVAEMQANLRSIEKILDQFFRDPKQRAELPQAEKLLSQIGGALSVLGHEQAGAAIRAGQADIRRFGEPDYEAVPEEFERVAESLGAVGFYIESLQHRADSGAMFKFDETTGTFTADLKRPVPAAPEPVEEPDPDPNSPGSGGSTTHSEPDSKTEETSVEENAARHGDVAAELVRSFWHDPDDEGTRAELVSALQQVKQDALLLDDSSLKDKATQALKMLSESTQGVSNDALQAAVTEVANQANRLAGHEAARPTPASVSAPVPVAETAVDAELLEIFLMEAEEVLGNADAALATLRAEHGNREALTNLRRAYHTLKGSGRMVGLTAIGEAGWGVEQTLNHWLAESKPADHALFDLLAYCSSELTSWVAELKSEGSSARQPDAIVRAAESVREGRPFVAGEAAEPVQAQVEDPHADEAHVAEAPVGETVAHAEPDQSPTIDKLAPERVDDFLATEILSPDALDSAIEFDAHAFEPKSVPVTTADEHQWMATELMPEGDVAEITATAAPATEDDLDFPLFDEPHLVPSSATPEAPAVLEHALAEESAPAVQEPGTLQALPPGMQQDHDLTFAATEVLGSVEEIEGAPATDFSGEDIFAADEPSAAPVLEAHGEHQVPEAGLPAEQLPEDLTTTYVTGGDVDYSFEIPPVIVPPPMRATILPFAPLAARTDEHKEIGHLSISVPLYNIYLTEADELLRVLTSDFGEWRHELSRNVSEAAVRAAHSLAGTSATVGLSVVHDLASALESVLQTLHRKPVPVEIAEVLLLEEGVESLRGMLHRFAAEIMPDNDFDTTRRLYTLRDELRARHDPAQHVSTPPLDGMTRTNWLEGEGHDEPQRPPDTAAADMSEPPLDLHSEPLTVSYNTAQESVAAMGEADAASHADEEADEVEADAAKTEASGALSQSVADEVSGEHSHWQTEAKAAATAPEPSPVSPPLLAELPAVVDAEPHQSPARADAPSGATGTSADRVRDEIDAELIEIFLQEASEYMPQISENLREWQAQPKAVAIAQSLMRQLHTVKGSARMAGAMRLGEVVHDMETRVELAVTLRDIPASLFDELLAFYDRASELYDALMRPDQIPAEPAFVATGGAANAGNALMQEPDTQTAQGLPATVERSAAFVAPATAGSALPQRPVLAQAGQQVVQAVRVRADVLDRLVNQAGEVSISRSRLENEVLQIKTSLSDLTENLGRLRTQLREIEIQAETQMQSQLSMVKERERFDPLEFDRFTRLQELTRMMAESVSDVGTVQQNMVRSLDGASRDLSAQQRMTRDLQQDLMRVRMVPFSSVSERLYRVVRQSAKEVDKRVNLDIRGGGVEIDRSVLERMAAPFEHLLRNAVVHGVESRADRQQQGKNETGELMVEVRQEGNEIVLVFSDDGAGLNVERIRDKARAVGLIASDEEIGDTRVADLIFQPGFTTASEVTELAGRGFGMDVVRAEAGGLGGRVSVDSTPGAGTRFTINLPLTLAVTQVVLVTVASRTYAIPSVLVEQVQQLRPQPLAQAYNDGHVMWLNQPVKLHFLAGLLGQSNSSPIAQRYSPLLVLRSGGDRVVIHVDEVIGNQEVVVKNIGPQLARMSGIAGATVLGSGDIVLILNPVQLAQQAERERLAHPTPDAEIGGAVAELILEEPVASRSEPVAGLETLPTVMVVDDSLTVRRVTQRLLAREGYQVVLAKDGVDALQQLQDYTPDAMLVDIEMPRMDGFDLTRNIRSDERYNSIPIIMITSRTADKHRDFAMELGVNVYMGKPYQEDELLGHLAKFIGARRRATA